MDGYLNEKDLSCGNQHPGLIWLIIMEIIYTNVSGLILDIMLMGNFDHSSPLFKVNV